MLLCVNVSASLGCSLVPWTIIEVNEESYTFESLFTSMQAGRFDSIGGGHGRSENSENLMIAGGVLCKQWLQWNFNSIINNNNNHPHACTSISLWDRKQEFYY